MFSKWPQSGGPYGFAWAMFSTYQRRMLLSKAPTGDLLTRGDKGHHRNVAGVPLERLTYLLARFDLPNPQRIVFAVAD